MARVVTNKADQSISTTYDKNKEVVGAGAGLPMSSESANKMARDPIHTTDTHPQLPFSDPLLAVSNTSATSDTSQSVPSGIWEDWSSFMKTFDPSSGVAPNSIQDQQNPLP